MIKGLADPLARRDGARACADGVLGSEGRRAREEAGLAAAIWQESRPLLWPPSSCNGWMKMA